MLNSKEINTLKAKIKAELLRRDGSGSLAAYGSADYDFALVPEEGTPILAEHGQKTVNLLLKIGPYKDLKNVEKES